MTAKTVFLQSKTETLVENRLPNSSKKLIMLCSLIAWKIRLSYKRDAIECCTYQNVQPVGTYGLTHRDWQFHQSLVAKRIYIFSQDETEATACLWRCAQTWRACTNIYECTNNNTCAVWYKELIARPVIEVAINIDQKGVANWSNFVLELLIKEAFISNRNPSFKIYS